MKNALGKMKLVKAGEGVGRHKTLFRFGLKLRGIELPAADIINEMRVYNNEAFDPPLKKYDFDRIVLAVIEWQFDKTGATK